MGKQIIQQPNGKYCIFSSIVDNITHYDMSEEEIIEEWVNEYREEITKKVKDICSKLQDNCNPYGHFTKTFDDMIKTISNIHGEKEANEIKNIILGKTHTEHE